MRLHKKEIARRQIDTAIELKKWHTAWCHSLLIHQGVNHADATPRSRYPV